MCPNGDGTFQEAANYGVEKGSRSVVIGDLDGDGYSDLVVANRDSNYVSILINQTDSGGGGCFIASMHIGGGFGMGLLVLCLLPVGVLWIGSRRISRKPA